MSVPPGGVRERVRRVIEHSVFRNATMLFIVSLLNYLMPLILVPYLARVLGIDTFGVYAFGMSLYLIGMLLIDYGFPVFGLYSIAEHRHDRERVSRILGAMLIIKLGLFAVLVAVLVIYAYVNQQFTEHRLFLILTALPVLGGALQFRWVFQAVEQSGKILKYTLTGRLAQLALVIAFVSGPGDYLWVPVFHGIGMLVGAAMCIGMIYRLGYRFSLPRWHEVVEQVRGAASYFMANVAEAQMGFAGVFSLSLVTTPAVIAIYAVSEQLYRALRSMCHPLVDALMPYMKRSNDMRAFRRICVMVFGVTAIGVLAGIALAPFIIHLLFGAKYAAAVPILQILLPALLVCVPALLIGYPLLAATGYGDQVSGIAVASAIVAAGLLVALWFFEALNPKTVALTFVASEIMIFLGTMALLGYSQSGRRRDAAVRAAQQGQA